MNFRILLGLLFLVLLARLRLTFRDEGAKRSDLLVIGGLPLLSLLFLQINWSWLVLLVFFPLMALLMRWTEAHKELRNHWRLLSMPIYFLVPAVLCGPVGELRVNQLPIRIVEYINTELLPERSLFDPEILRIELYLFGMIFVLNEMNILLRYLLHLFQLDPLENNGKKEVRTVDEEEYNTGRVIGMLERIFVYIFVLAGQFTAIGFILAAKGVARFREFENRTFAEYVLIGTLLSTLLALFVGYFIGWSVNWIK